MSRVDGRFRKFFEERDIYFETTKTFRDCTRKRPLRFDFYLPDHNLLINYHGPQFFHRVTIYSNGEQGLLERLQNNSRIKTFYALTRGIRILNIDYTNNDRIETIIEQMLTSKQSFLFTHPTLYDYLFK